MTKRSRKKSKQRAAESARALAKSGAGLAASFALGPAGGLVVVGLERLVEHARGVVSERRQRRVKQFHEELLAGIPAAEQSAFLERVESDADVAAEYARILEQVWEDDEEEKTGIYARLLRFLLGNVSDGRTRRHLVRSVRTLFASDLELLKAALRIGGWPWSDEETKTDAERAERQAHFQRQQDFLNDTDPINLSGIQRLEQAGFIKRTPVMGGDRLEVTPLGRQLLQAVESVDVVH
jgi:hypothetical protein